MRNKGQLIIGALLVLWGISALVGTIFHIDLGALCFPLGLIAIGAWLVLRPRLTGPGTGSEVVLIGDQKRRGSWTVTNTEYWVGVADIDLDMLEAAFAPGETKISVYGFVGDVDIFVPRAVGVTVHAGGFVIDSDLLGRTRDSIINTVEATSANYNEAECKLVVETGCFVTNIKVRQI
jgi:hypothetical protein